MDSRLRGNKKIAGEGLAAEEMNVGASGRLASRP